MSGHGASAAETALPPLGTGPHRKRIGLISIVACFGGLLFGYDTGVSSGAEGPMSEELGLSLIQTGIVISSLVFAAAVGALVGGRLSDAIGRRKTILVLSIMFFVGVVFVVFAPGFEVVVVGRTILGLAVGGASTVVPVYLAERHRSRSAAPSPAATRWPSSPASSPPSLSTPSSTPPSATSKACGGSCSPSAPCPPSPCSSACCGCPNPRAG
ncbi:putative inositol transporter [Microlunatus phosphovorus NM-1]|uniref:Putative inositol transporter n=1 Tax=Microlunatus phosphovorus (strain ATCC 700054 / DSM 10555 / JCM 9379 / NBRC 101784 / NCIMB 13414 / VKM Ac-1990 / NM-1) TaxID=1032480 RepID=F5XDP1_MICPN|nr:putative inositol transporter [Microlunatus phosphovorus NM-1]